MLIYQGMNICEFNYLFNIRSAHETGLHIGVISKNLGYTNIHKEKVYKAYNIEQQDVDSLSYVKDITSKVEVVHNKEIERMSNMCQQLQLKWNNFKKQYFNCLEKGLGIEFSKDEIYNTYCYLHLLPINEINFQNNIIYLNCNDDIDEVFKNFIVMVTKAILLDRCGDLKSWQTNYEFEAQNKVWMFAEIAVDSIFANTELSSFCPNPSYKYFYSLKIDGVNFMNEFRKLHKLVSWDDFCNSVYMFVYKHYKSILQFKNYLY